MTQRAFFFDLDGTLAVDNRSASDTDIEAIRAVRRQGDLVFLCTGRAPCQVYEAIRSIGFDGEVTGGGTHISLGDKILYRNKIRSDTVRKTISAFLENGGTCILEGEQNLYSVNPRPDGWEAPFPAITHPDDFAPGKGKYSGQVLLKFFAFADSCNGFSHLFLPEFNIIDHGESAFECVPKPSSKAEGMRIILKTVGIDRRNSVAFGDSPNDLEMLKFAGTGIAMGNAPGIVKSAADAVTASVSENGISAALRKYIKTHNLAGGTEQSK